MSHEENTKWIESAIQNFDEALSLNNFAQAKAIIADVKEYGFNIEAQRMTEILKALNQ